MLRVYEKTAEQAGAGRVAARATRVVLAALLTSTALVAGAPAWADSIVWRGGFDNSYSQIANWQNITTIGANRVPTGNDTAFVTDGTALLQPELFGGFTASTRTVVVGSNAGAVTLTVNGALGLGDPGSAGALNIATGSGVPVNAVGTVVVSGAGASVGAAVDAFGGGNPALNMATVFGSDGTLRIENGGAGTFTTICRACGGAPFKGTGFVEVDGAGSTLDITSAAASLRVGETTGTGGTGFLRIRNGGSATLAGGVGDFLGVASEIEVRGDDGAGNASHLTWNGVLTALGKITVTDGALAEFGVLDLRDTGELSVTSGAQLNQVAGEIGNWNLGQQTAVEIIGAGTEVNVNGALSVVSSNIGAGSADVVISNGAVVNVNSASQSGLAFGEERFFFVNDAELNMTGGLLMNRGHLSATNATLNFGAGPLNMGSLFDGNTLSLSNTDITAAQITTNATGAGLGNVINLGGTAGGPAGAVGAFNVGAVSLNGSGGGSELVINHTGTDYDIGSVFGSTGTIRHVAGDTIFSGASGAFAGQTLVTGGALAVNGTLGNGSHNFSLSNGAVLGGSGTIGGAALISDATLAPGNSPGTLSFAGNLALSATSILDFELGNPAGVAGVDSDLINVGGNLVLDGTLNVTDVGGFGTGLYRLFNYGGALVDNGLALGVAPAGFDATNLTVQTATAGQVNLLAGAPIGGSFFLWDGANAVANNVVDGGAGTWTAAGTNWTVASGATNGAFDRTQQLIFAAPGGLVSVDAAGGAINVDEGMQFAADGYVLTGDDISIGANDIILRIGDGTAAGAGFVTEIRNDIIGTGDIEFTDLGTLVFDGSNSGTGSFEVNNGRAIVTGVLTNPTVFALGGSTLGGTGVILGNVTVNPGATLAAGDPVGSASSISSLLTGNLTFAAGSVLEVELNDGGNAFGVNNDIIDALGFVRIDGGTIHVTPENGTDDGTTYAPGTVYTVVRADTMVTGTFDSVTDDYAFLTFSDSYDADHVYITSALVAPAAPCTALSLTFNQDATCGGVMSIGAGALHTAVLNLSNTEAPVALDQLSGEIHASAQTALIGESRYAREAALGRLRGGPEGTGRWVQGIGSWDQWGGDGNAATLGRTIGGLMIGADTAVNEAVTFGVMGGFSRSGLDVSDRMSSGKVESYTLGAYAGGDWGAFSLKGGLSYSWHALDTSRNVAFTGFADSLSASYKARSFQAFTEAAYTIETAKGRIEPYANLTFVNLMTDGYSEAGGAAALTSGKQSVKTTFTTLGVRGEMPLDLGQNKATLSGGIGWRHAFGDAPSATHTFAGGTAFTVAGVPVARDALVVDAGLSVDLSKTAKFGISYTGQLSSGRANHAATVGFNVRF